jgi:hypothetical protein
MNAEQQGHRGGVDGGGLVGVRGRVRATGVEGGSLGENTGAGAGAEEEVRESSTGRGGADGMRSRFARRCALWSC